MGGQMNVRENWLRAVEYRYPEWIPCSVGFAPLMWKIYREDLEKLIADHPRVFPGHKPGSVDYDDMPVVYREGETFTDNWGCVWANIQEGLEGQVVGHPLADWSVLETYRFPDPLVYAERGPRDWEQAKIDLADAHARGLLFGGNGERLFDRLYFLRGFDNLMMDFALEPPQLQRLIDMLRDHELRLVNEWLKYDIDSMGFHTDIGTQRSLMISPAKFRKYIKPMFTAIFQTVRRAGKPVILSSDGMLLEIVDDLVEAGVSIHDPQVRANTLEGIAKHYKGKLCCNVDMDRQSFPFATPQQLRDEVRRAVDLIALPEGGMTIQAGIYGGRDVPMRNIVAIVEAMEAYCFQH
jgi:uroporphyrinogen decarboxylase